MTIIVVARLKAKETRRELGDRHRWQPILAKQLYQKGLERTKVTNPSPTRVAG